MNKHHEDVARFMEASGQTPSIGTAELYMALVTEEFRELREGWSQVGDPDLDQASAVEATLDALGDLAWVVYGMALALGACPDRVWSPIREANFAKIDPATGKVLRRPDGKVMKPAGWKPPCHAKEVARVIERLQIEKA